MNFKKMAKRAALVFQAAEWKWYAPGKDVIPDRKRIEGALESLYETVTEDPDTNYSETGRLIVFRNRDEDGVDEIKVCLILGSE